MYSEAGPSAYQQPYPQPPLVRPTSSLATASMILGILGLFAGWCSFGIPCALAVILGHFALQETKSGARGGHGMAIAGLLLGYILLVPMILITILMGTSILIGSSTP